MEKAKVLTYEIPIGDARITTVSKPPWVASPHKGALERMILMIGQGKGVFSEPSFIPRSLGCIGNNRLVLYRDPIPLKKFKRVIDEFRSITKSGEIYITNYDNIEDAIELAEYAAFKGIETYVTIAMEDWDRVPKERKFKVIGEVLFNELSNVRNPNVDILLIMATYPQYKELLNKKLDFRGEVWVDILYPGSLRLMDFNPLELRKIINPTSIVYNNCMAGLIAITPEGFVIPCPLLRKFIVGDITRENLRSILRKQRLKKFWKLTKDAISPCKTCSLRYICHDCRALEYQATGDILGIEFCPL
ncbi:SPASM domain-containing protein [Pyrococcus kukulkanii]|uniref:SPASM domain-containing protein n=1 Tax=Pyrococcus kukulkanii TaxID=1609559 RepID=UPI003567BA95